MISKNGQMSILIVNGRRIDYGLMRLLRLAVELHTNMTMSEAEKDRIYQRAYRKTMNRRRYMRQYHRRRAA